MNLRNLIAYDNPYSSIAVVSSLPKLREIQFGQTAVADLTPLTGKTTIETLQFESIGVQDISVLATLPNLHSLNARNNTIANLSPLANLQNLNGLYLSKNQIEDLAPLVQNAGIATGDSVEFLDNPIDCTAQAANIATLTGRGVRLSGPCP
ncbi:MAG: hypothetical protein QM756_35340 [Polyangiaceae bacterium]